MNWRLVSNWYYEPRQLQRIISGPERNFNLSPSHSAHKSEGKGFRQTGPLNGASSIREVFLQEFYCITYPSTAYSDIWLLDGLSWSSNTCQGQASLHWFLADTRKRLLYSGPTSTFPGWWVYPVVGSHKWFNISLLIPCNWIATSCWDKGHQICASYRLTSQ